ncbi:MAG: hypothetical protein ABI402_11040 [Ferruginibacter sp.]
MLLSVNHRKELSGTPQQDALDNAYATFFQHTIQRLLNFLANSFSKLFVSLLTDFYSAFRNP